MESFDFVSEIKIIYLIFLDEFQYKYAKIFINASIAIDNLDINV
jgi:hypothetical protein